MSYEDDTYRARREAPAFIDLMAFTRGQEQANDANWRDEIRDINARSAEEKLRQSQTMFDLALPGTQFAVEADYTKQLGNRAGAEFQTNLFTEAGKLPPDQQTSFIANAFKKRLQEIDPTAPGATAERLSLTNAAVLRAGNMVTTDPEAAAELYGLVPGRQDYVASVRDLAKWSDPKVANDPINLLEAANSIGAQFDPATNLYAIPGTNTRLNQYELINLKREQAQNKVSNVTPQLQRSQAVQNSIDTNSGIMEQLRNLGISAVVNPNTGGLQVLGRFGAPGTPTTAEPPAYTGLPQASTIPGMRASINPLAGTQPVFAPEVLAAETQRDATPPALRIPALSAPVQQPVLSVPPVAEPASEVQRASQQYDQTRIYRQGIEKALLSFGVNQRRQMPEAFQYYQQELQRAKAVEAQDFAQYQRSLDPVQTSAVQNSNWITRR
jgi:hypothetical protein